jgi:hypothetical protein
MKYTTIILAVFFSASGLHAQELFIQSEPASNMPAGIWGVRVSSESWEGDHTISRIGIEGMYGVDKYLMVHPLIYGSNQLNGFNVETYGGYAKYRLYIDDGFKYHFRVAAFGEVLAGEQHSTYPSFSFNGSQPFAGAGMMATLLENRFATNLSVAANDAFKSIPLANGSYSNIKGINSILSAGYLVYPPRYTSFSNPNINIYAEFLDYQSWFDHVWGGNSLLEQGNELLLSFGPQVILNSVARFDLAYVALLYSDLPERRPNTVFARFEYNFY